MADQTAPDEYTLAQRRVIDARLAMALNETKEGDAHGPFDNACEIASFLKDYGKGTSQIVNAPKTLYPIRSRAVPGSRRKLESVPKRGFAVPSWFEKE
jgi:hypothetical protein